MLTGISLESLLEALEQAPPYTLKSVELLRTYQATGQMPTPEDRAVATAEQIKYSETCERLAINVRSLNPTPLLIPELSETFPL